MNRKFNWKRNAKLVVVVLCAAAAKLYYSTASVNELRWILAPTTLLVELVSGARFEFESHAGYMSSDRSFIIAASCAGVNFLITSFLMLSLSKWWRDRSQQGRCQKSEVSGQQLSDKISNCGAKLRWRFIPLAALFAYLATLVANTVRISTALYLNSMPPEISWLTANQLHRLEGIFIYFGFLLLVFMVSEKMSSDGAWTSQSETFRKRTCPPSGATSGLSKRTVDGGGGLPPWVSQSAMFRKRICPPSGATSGLSKRTLGEGLSKRTLGECLSKRTLGECLSKRTLGVARGLLRQSLFPLLVYYATTLGIPIANGAYRQGSGFWEHSLFVLLTPLLLIIPLASFRFFRYQRSLVNERISTTTQSVR